MSTLFRLPRKSSLTIFAIGALAVAAQCLEVTSPSECEKFPSAAANLCRMELMRTGSFKFRRITSTRECHTLSDAASVAQCRQAVTRGESHYASTSDRRELSKTAMQEGGDSASIPKDVATAYPERMEPYVPPTLEERNTEALETIATYTRLQAVTVVGLLSVGLLVGLIIAIAN